MNIEVGSTLPKRDAVDLRFIEQVRSGSGLATTKQGIITVRSLSQYGVTKVADADRDGITDAWEPAIGLDPMNPADAQRASASDGYTKFECYLNGLDPRRPIDFTDLDANIDSMRGQ